MNELTGEPVAAKPARTVSDATNTSRRVRAALAGDLTALYPTLTLTGATTS